MNISNLKDTYPILRLKEMKHRVVYKSSDRRTSQAMLRYEACTEKKPPGRITEELRLCQHFWKCHPLFYYRYDLYKEDRQLSEEELLNFIPEFFFYRLFMPHFTNGKYDILLMGDKIVTEKLFKGLAIPQAETIGFLIQNRLYDPDLKRIGYADLEKKMYESSGTKVFVKPANGMAGAGIHILLREGERKFHTLSSESFGEEFLKSLDGGNNYIFQAGIEQAAGISNIYHCSVNTLRIVTENRGGEARVFICMLRIGRNGMQIDNASADGIFVKVDPSTGNLAERAYSLDCESFDRHPDTGFCFKGNTIPRWNEVENLAVESALKLPQFRYIGWDFCMTPAGPLVLEAHSVMGIDGIQIAHQGLRGNFEIQDPLFYWQNYAKRIR